MFKCILVSLDGSLESEAVLPVLEKMLRASPAKIILLRVAPDVAVSSATREFTTAFAPDVRGAREAIDSVYAITEREVLGYLESISSRLVQAGASETALEFSFNEPVAEIMHCAKRHHVDLIAMATHGRTGLTRMLQGSVTESVLHHAPCPMLIVRTGFDTEPFSEGDDELNGYPRN